MLVVQIKGKEELVQTLANAETLVVKCIGCREVYFPENDSANFIKDLKNSPGIIDILTVDYLCNYEFTKKRIELYKEKINNTKTLLVFSCGIGVQILASALPDKRVVPACDTIYINGAQGLTPNKYDCAQCGECYLNYTYGICPITNCKKSLLNGPCGGSKNGKCEVDKEQECAWEKIYKRVEKFNGIKNFLDTIKVRDYSKLLIIEKDVK